MKYLATADSLVTDDLITWEIEADTPEEAWNKGFDLARNSDYAEEGSVMVRPLEEDKQAICDKLLETLQLTSNLYDLIYLKYLRDEEKVLAIFRNRDKTVNVAMDSGTSMIRDIIKGIV